MLENQEKEINLAGSSKKSTLIGVFLIVLALAVYMLLIRPFVEQSAVLKTNIVAKGEELAKVGEEIKNYKDFEEKLNLSTEVNKQEVFKAIPSQMRQDEVIEDIINIADTYDITLNSISFSKGGSGQDSVKSLVVNASFIGNYNDLVDFLEGIEQNPRVFKVNSISVQINKLDISKLERASFSLAIETFYQE